MDFISLVEVSSNNSETITDKRTNLDSESLEALMHLSHRNVNNIIGT